MDRSLVRWLAVFLLAPSAPGSAQSLGPPRPVYAEGPVFYALQAPVDAPVSAGSLSASLLVRTDVSTLTGYSVVATHPSNGSIAWRRDDLVQLCGLETAGPVNADIRVHSSGRVVVLLDVFADQYQQCLYTLDLDTGAPVWVRKREWESSECPGTCRSFVAFGESGDLILATPGPTRPRLSRLAIEDGSVSWEQTPSFPVQSRSGTWAMTDAQQGAFSVSFQLDQTGLPRSASTRTYREDTGAENWRLDTSLAGLNVNQLSTDLRRRSDGDVLELVRDDKPAERAGFVRRIDSTGAERWRISSTEFEERFPGRILAHDGDPAIRMDSPNDAGITVLDQDTGLTQWSMVFDGIWARILVAGDRIHVLSGVHEGNGTLVSARLLSLVRHDGATVSNVPVALHPSGMWYDHTHIVALEDGDLLLTGIAGRTMAWIPQPDLHVQRLRPGEGSLWSITQPIPGDRPILLIQDRVESDQFVLDAPIGARFAYVIGYEPDQYFEEPRPGLRKVELETAEVPWIWRPQPSHSILPLVVDSVSGGLLVASSSNTAFSISAVDPLSGTTTWVAGELEGRAVGFAATGSAEIVLSRKPAGFAIATTLSARAPDTGQLLWSVDTVSPDVEPVALESLSDGNTAFATRYSSGSGTSGLSLHKRNSADGSTLWDVELEHSHQEAPSRIKAIPGGDALVFSGTNAWRVRGSDGDVLWHRDLGTALGSALIGDAGDIYVAGAAVVRLEPVTGQILWMTPFLDGPAIVSGMTMSSHGSLLVFSPDGMLAGEIGTSNGLLRWHVSADQAPDATIRYAPSNRGISFGPSLVAESMNGRVVFGSTTGQADPTLTLFDVSAIWGDTIFSDGFE